MTCLRCLRNIEGPKRYGLHEQCFLTWFNLPQATEFTDLDRKATSKEPVVNGTKITAMNSSFFHGKFKKYSATLNGESYILKVRENEYPELPDVEYLSNVIARELEIPVPPFYLIEFAEGEGHTFVTKNFVRQSGTLTNLVHIFHFFEDQNKLDCESIIKILERETKRYNDIDTFVKVCLFDALIGNSDRHGRNLGILTTSKASVLAPIYDNPSALGLESGSILKAQFGPKGKIFTKASKEPTMKDYVIEFKRLGYKDSIQEFHARLQEVDLNELIDESFCTDLMKQAINRVIIERTGELNDEI
jgi:hypothetical protein